MRKLLYILYLIPVMYLMALPAYFEVSGGNQPYRAIKVVIADSSKAKFVTRGEITGIVKRTTGNTPDMKCKELPLSQIEENVRKLSELGVVEAYVTVTGDLVVEVDQREPIMRVVTADNRDLFVDDKGYMFFRRGGYTPRLHIVAGSLSLPEGVKNGETILGRGKRTRMEEALDLVKFIRSDRFWSAQIDQIYFRGDGDIDLVPRVGSHIIHLGPAGGYEEKFKYLEAFYKEALPRVGWNKYREIDLEFKGQIVCRK